MKEFSWTLRGIVGAVLGGAIYMVVGSGFEIDWIPFIAIGAALGLVLGATTWEKLAAVVLVGTGLWLINPMVAIAGIGVLGGLFLLISRFKGGTGNSATHATQAQHQGDHAEEPSHAPASNGNGNGLHVGFSVDDGQVNIKRYNDNDHRLRRMEQLMIHMKHTDPAIAGMAIEEHQRLAAQCLREQGGDPRKYFPQEEHGPEEENEEPHALPQPLIIGEATNPIFDWILRRNKHD